MTILVWVVLTSSQFLNKKNKGLYNCMQYIFVRNDSLWEELVKKRLNFIFMVNLWMSMLPVEELLDELCVGQSWLQGTGCVAIHCQGNITLMIGLMLLCGTWSGLQLFQVFEFFNQFFTVSCIWNYSTLQRKTDDIKA